MGLRSVGLLITCVIVIIIVVFFLSIQQVSEPQITRCEMNKGDCRLECDGWNFAEPDMIGLDCPDGLKCCLS